MKQEEMQFDYNMDDQLFFEENSLPEFNPPSINLNSSIKKEDGNFLEAMEWDSFTNNNQNEENSFLENLFNTEGNIFGNETISTNNLDQLLMSNDEMAPNNNNNNQNDVQEEGEKQIKQPILNKNNTIPQLIIEETYLEKMPKTKKTKTEPKTPNSSKQPQQQQIAPTTPIKKKSKKDMTPEEIEEKKKIQLEKRLIKNRRTAEISRNRKKAKKYTLEESMIQLTEQSKMLEKQSLEVAVENRVLKTEYYALLSLILNIPALAKKFDKISEIVVDQKDNKKIFNDQSGQIASVYLYNIIFSIHQQWIQMKQNSLNNLNSLPIDNTLQNVIVN